MAQSLTHKLFGGSVQHTLQQPSVKPDNGGYSVVTPTNIQKPYLRGAKLVVPLKPPGMYMKKPKV